MGKTKKVFAVKNFKDGNLPENIGEILDNADENELRTLVILLMSSDTNGNVTSDIDIPSVLNISPTELESYINFWRGTGLIGYASKNKTEKKEEENKDTSVTYAHKGGAVEKTVGVVEYRTGELANILEKRKELARFVDEAQRVYGKTLNMGEIGILIGLIDQYGFEPSAILAILSHTARTGKRGVRYVEKTAISFYDEGITSGADAVEKVQRIEAAAETASRIKELFGIGSRSLSTTEKNLFKKWTETFGYDIDVIKRAYDITIDAIHEPKPKYTNGVLEKWYGENLRTLNDIEKFEESKIAKQIGQAAAKSDKSYDINEFFDAALKRSFEEL